MMSGIEIITPNWPAPANIRAFSTTRKGGLSEAEYQSLNLGTHVGDRLSTVNSNRQQLQRHVGLTTNPYWLDQTHSSEVLNIDGCVDSLCFDETNTDTLIADASITSHVNRACVVMTADCLPVLLCSKDGGQVAAVHAGWRGMADGIIENAIHLFNSSASDILAWCGPCIGPSAFEVGLEVQQSLGGPVSAYLPHSDTNKVYVDLQQLAKHRLNELGVFNCYFSERCTYSEPEQFFSYRRDGVTGRMASFVWIDSINTQ